MSVISKCPIADWIPYKLRFEQQEWMFEWLYLENKRFIEPFFDETVGKCKSLANNSKYIRTVSDYESLIWQGETVDAIHPTAIIFHVSRCGSTLLSQLLGLNENWISLAEVPLFDEILRSPFKQSHITAPEVKKALKANIALVGKRRFNEECLFVKTDSWHIFFYEMYRSLYPDVPFILLYRKPDEVIRSHQKLRGMQAVPGIIEPELFGFKRDDVITADLDAYLVKVLIKYQQKYLEIAAADPRVQLVNYDEGPVTLVQKIAKATQLTLEDDFLQKVTERSGFHSKFPDKPFAEKQETELSISGLPDAMELYHKLEQLRNH
ncbi:sulfotransferase family protein [Solitalea canadensis]|uniref:Sulfotransferase family protein n=1 Tax=Solitalea canadensis (strain ATCC 29591 / DSM 3403 / JCM 21819 / LMG 8368 / NBRC 15130 / NCIMB 12057 / USAM 9D) TaxID=929556 RepID=H8KRR6_SOLCM|nr:sulfotransferase family protein [Solitalea canadensis]AFD07704.1 hypothetical protein Solca_2670 [Solitalea canadensis DSM 3403]